MSDRQHYWTTHLDRIAAEGISTKAYAEREGLSAAALYYWRKRLKAEAASSDTHSAAPTPKRCLVPVEITGKQPPGACTLTVAPGIQLELAQWPSPEWLARLATAQAAPPR